MKKPYPLFFFLGLGLLLVAGCDVSNNSSGGGVVDPGGSGGEGEPGDPVVVDFPIAYVQRKVPLPGSQAMMMAEAENVLEPTFTQPGAVLVMRDRASASASARVITAGVFPAVPPEDDPEGEPVEPEYDVRDLSTNEDGTKLVFAMRAPLLENVEEDEQPTWNIWEYDRIADTLTRVIESDIQAESGHDRYPVYLTDGSIAFSSTRQRQSRALLLDQSRPQYSYVTDADDDVRAFTLHRIDEDRREITQISYGKGHDIQPTVLSNGQLLFLRGDGNSNANPNRLSLYTINPDGSNLSAHYGFHSPEGGPGPDDGVQAALQKPFQMPDGRILVNLRPRETDLLGGDIGAIDTENYIDLTQPTTANTGATGPAQVGLAWGEVRLNAQSPGGYFNSAAPLFDGTDRLLVSWMPCLVLSFDFDVFIEVEMLNDEQIENGQTPRYFLINALGEYVDRSGNRLDDGAVPIEVSEDEITALPCTSDSFDNPLIQPASPQYGLWVYDVNGNTQSPVLFTGDLSIAFTDVAVFAPRPIPDFIPSPGGDPFSDELLAENVGILHIRSIFDIDGQDAAPNGIASMADPTQTSADERPVRFVRFLEHANLPHEDEYEIDFGLVRGRNNQPAKSILGYAEVHPDGSIMTKLPANVAFTMEFLDANGRRVTGPFAARHRNWLNVRPGEVRTCNGCHTPTSTQPHGRPDAEPEPANAGALAPALWPNTLLEPLRDPADPDTVPSAYPPPAVGETMAQYYVRMRRADPNRGNFDPLTPSLDIVWEDVWTANGTPGAPINLSYGIPEAPGPNNLLTPAPVLIASCLSEWTHLCRAVVDYPDHIQPIFEVPRSAVRNGVTVDVTCTNCHSTTDIDGVAQVPAPDQGNLQLDFTNAISPLDDDMVLLRGYDELFAAGEPLVALDDMGNPVPLLVPVLDDNGDPVFEMVQQMDPVTGDLLFDFRDQAGQQFCLPQDTDDPNLTLQVDGNNAPVPCLEIAVDDDGLPIQLFEPATQNRYLNGNGANAQQNRRFFQVFEPGGDHEGYLTPAELKLFSEWLDLGGQYYNELFKALED